MLIQQLFQQFITHQKLENRAPSTIKNYDTALYTHLDELIGHIQIDELGRSHIRYILDQLKDKAPSVPQSVMSVLRTFLRFVRDETHHQLQINPESVQVPSYECDPKVVHLSKKEIQVIRNAIPTDTMHGLRTRALFELLLHSGLRLSEALRLNKDDINIEQGTIRVENTKGVRHGSKRIEKAYMHGATKWVRKYITYRLDDDDALFYVTPKCGRGGHRLTRDTAQSYMRSLAERTDTNAGHHILRRTFCTELINRGVDPKKTQHLMRHKNISTTYNHYVAVEKESLGKIHRNEISTAFSE